MGAFSTIQKSINPSKVLLGMVYGIGYSWSSPLSIVSKCFHKPSRLPQYIPQEYASRTHCAIIGRVIVIESTPESSKNLMYSLVADSLLIISDQVTLIGKLNTNIWSKNFPQIPVFLFPSSRPSGELLPSLLGGIGRRSFAASNRVIRCCIASLSGIGLLLLEYTVAFPYI